MRKSSTSSRTPQSPRLRTVRQAKRQSKYGVTPTNSGADTPGSLRRSGRKKTERCPPIAARLQLELDGSSADEDPSPVQSKGRRKSSVKFLQQDDIMKELNFISTEEEDDDEDEEIESNSKSKVSKKPQVKNRLTRGRGRPKGSKQNKAEEESANDSNSSETGKLRRSGRTPIRPKKLIGKNFKHSAKSYLEPSPDTEEEKAGPSRKRHTQQQTKDSSDEEEPIKEQQKIKSRNSTRRTTRGSSQQNSKSPEENTPASSSLKLPLSRKRSAAIKGATEQTPEPGTPRSLRKRAAPNETIQVESTPKTSKTTANKTVSKTSKTVEPKPSTSQTKKIEWKFNVYGIPKCPLPCRESQFEEIWKFVFENVTEKNSGCMYVSGVPGTGKTVIVQAVVDTMKKINDEKKNLDFKYLYVNGLTLASPDKLWKRMFKGLNLTSKSTGISSKEALKRLDSYFEGHQRTPVVLVVDELDQILDKQQSILYQLLEWSSHATNMFSFLAIFNTISLPEHGLAMRNNSRMGFKRAVFPPYSYEELQTIVLNMLKTFKTARLSPECVSLLSRKVAAISGDARRALEIARRTLEIVESGDYSGMQAVSHAFKEIFSSAKIETIKYTSFLEQIILKTICDEIRCSGVEEVLIAKVYEAVISKAVYEGFQYYKDDILKALLRLAVMRLVIVEDNRPSIHKRLLLKVPVEDVNFALGCHTDMQLEN